MTERTTADPPAAVLDVTQETQDDTIRPFHIDVPEDELVDLRRRIAATRWPDKETVTDQSQGVPLATMQALARYWENEYDWRKCEAKLSALPHFITEIDGLDIHFIHVRSEHEDALPLIVAHGWPGSVIEQLKIIEPLTDPTAHGASAADAFHLVIPSMPGYGFSGKPTTTGWDAVRMARAYTVLMKRLGYTRYVAQGGDWGGLVVDQMGVQAPPELIGIHTNFPGAVRDDVFAAAATSAPAPSGLSDEENRLYEKVKDFFATDVAYALELGTRPQTLYAVADSPVGLAAWLLDHDSVSLALIARVFDGQAEGLTRDDVLDNITHYWLTNTAVSSGRLYWENKLSFFGPKGVSIPVAVSVFPDELYQVPRDWAEQAYPELIYYNKVDKGGHFAAWEQPQLFSEEVRAGFRSLRQVTVFERLRMPSLGGATGWLNSEPLGPAELRGHAVLVNFWTFTCINWLRQEPYVRAWSQAYRDDGLVVIGAHTPEFSFEHEVDGVRQATKERGIDYPVAVDNDYGIWGAFDNHYWPALYFVDADGVIRDHHFGEGRYEQSERVIQRLLGIERELVSVEALGVEAEADWDHLRTSETYLGYERSEHFASPDGAAFDESRAYELPDRLRFNHWALAGEWTIGRENVVLDQAGGSIAYRFHARDAHLVLSPGARKPTPFRVHLDGEAPGPSHGVDVDDDGNGLLRDGRLYQLVRQHDTVRERTLEITFLEAGAEAYVFTFG